MKEKTKLEKEIRKAVGLSYKIGDTAPKVIAKGKGIVADRILDKAIEEDVQVYKDEELVNSLMNLEINEEIPEDLYEAIAEIIFYVYSIDSEKGKGKNE
ncbi:MAG: EscU/YscU/HrcU family type III secretion system export apparatus switch protein [Tissierellaceae bacterium]